MVFQPNNHVFGATSPLWCWLNALMIFVFQNFHAPLTGIFVLVVASHAAACFALICFARVMGCEKWAFLAGLGWSLLPDHISLFGMEYSLATFFAVSALIAHRSRRPFLTSAMCSALAMTRPEAAILGFLLFVDAVVKRRMRDAVQIAIPAFVIGIAALSLFQWYYGHPIPNTLAGKRLQLSNAAEFLWLHNVGVASWRYLLTEILRGDFYIALLFLVGAYTLSSCCIQMRKDSHSTVSVILLLWIVAHLLVLTVLGVAHYRWYLWPIWLTLPMCVACGFEQLDRAATLALGSLRNSLVYPALLMLALAWQKPWIGTVGISQKARRDSYIALAKDVNALVGTSPSSLVAQEIGTLGFNLNSNVTIIDQFLLATSNPTPGRFPSIADFVAHFDPEFIVETHPKSDTLRPEERRFQELHQRDDFFLEFGSASTKCKYFMVKRYTSEFGMIVLYRRDRAQ